MAMTVCLNSPLAFIKPHAAHVQGIEFWLHRVISERGITILGRKIIEGPEIEARGLIDKHYAQIARTATTPDPSTLVLMPTARTAFQKAFGLSWEEALSKGKVMGGLTAVKYLGITAGQLMSLWAESKAAKIAPGFYVAFFPHHSIYVLNGFYPSVREIYTTGDARIMCFVLSFDPHALAWRAFRSDVIGATNPAVAAKKSIRGRLYQHPEFPQLKLDARDNVIHASASPFEALVEKLVWLDNFDPGSDPLGHLLQSHGFDISKILPWHRENPTVTLEGKEGALVDLLEDKDTPEVARNLASLIR